MEKLPVVARLYYTGSGHRRYRRASTRSGPGEALCFVSVAQEFIRRVEAERDALASKLNWMTFAARDVLDERRRQIDAEGWSLEHDDNNADGNMARAAACYALHAGGYRSDGVAILRFWPWLDGWWRPTTPRRDLVKAGALILAEIERLDRAEAAKNKPLSLRD